MNPGELEHKDKEDYENYGLHWSSSKMVKMIFQKKSLPIRTYRNLLSFQMLHLTIVI